MPESFAQMLHHLRALGSWLRPALQRLCRDGRKSVVKRAGKRLADLVN
jgi:hypothetical protein